MLWIGLTGGIGTGKSTVSRLLRDRGFSVIDADILAREVVGASSSTLAEVVRLFGPKSVLPNGEMDRKFVGQIVFSSSEKREQLEKIVHPAVRKLAEKRRQEVEAQGHWVAFYDVPLLFEKDMKALFDRVLLIACREDLQRSRMRDRDGLSEVEIDKRLQAQLPIAQKIPKADEVIFNEGSLQDLEAAVSAYLTRLKALSTP